MAAVEQAFYCEAAPSIKISDFEINLIDRYFSFLSSSRIPVNLERSSKMYYEESQYIFCLKEFFAILNTRFPVPPDPMITEPTWSLFFHEHLT
jgi:hypothetical protein